MGMAARRRPAMADLSEREALSWMADRLRRTAAFE
jgi:hypothetical protein